MDLLENEKKLNLMSKNARLHMLNYDISIIKKKTKIIYEDYLGLKIFEVK